MLTPAPGIGQPRRRLALLAILAVLLGVPHAADIDLEEPGEEPATGQAAAAQENAAEDLDAAMADKQKVRVCLVSVAAPDRKLGASFYWRTVPGWIAAETFPVRFKLDGQDAVEGADALGPVARERQAKDLALEYDYPPESVAGVGTGTHKLFPGGLALTLTDGQLKAGHPALLVAGTELRIVCAPVRLAGVAADGSAVPTPVKVAWNGGSLLRAEGVFNPLVIWLPVGVSYQSSFGNFAVAADGTLSAQQLAPGVTLVAGGLQKSVARTETAKPSAAAAGPESWTFSVRTERQTASGETVFRVFAPPHVVSGEPILLAVNTRQYEAVAEHPFAVENLASTTGVPVRRATAPAGLAATAARALECRPEALAWVAVGPAPDLRGAVTVLLQDKYAPHWRYQGVVAPAPGPLLLVPQRWRTAFTDSETALFMLLVGKGTVAGPAEITAQRVADAAAAATPAPPLTLGHLELPAVTESTPDSRLFALDCRALPPGDYDLQVRGGAVVSAPLRVTIVPWYRRSAFFLHTMSGCTGAWPTDRDGLNTLFRAGLDMATATGHRSMLDDGVPQYAADRVAATPGLPVEAALALTPNDLLLERLLRARMRMIDLTTLRSHGFYLESLSYHHSFPASVDRALRRFQVYTQQTGDYPSFFGINHSWFPSLWGYAEGGVPCDGHVGERNRALIENVTKAGFKDPPAADRAFYQENKFSGDPTRRARALEIQRQAVAYWLACNEFGFGRHNALYNGAARQVRPDLSCTLFENAGHDLGKPTRFLFNDMAASCYESYTDYGEWPMSPGYTTDWARGNAPGKPVWLTTDWGTSTEGKIKSLLHAVARGLSGGGVPMQEESGELERRAMGLRFIQQYGSLALQAVPDRQVAILSTAAEQLLTDRGQYVGHAAYYHLTRLGYPPIVLADFEVLRNGIPAGVQVLCLAQPQQPFQPELERKIADFANGGGRLLLLGKSLMQVAGAVTVPQPLRHIWQMAGFNQAVHQQMWEEFATVWRQPLTEALTKCGLTPLAATDPERALALALDAGPVRYVAVLQETQNAYAGVFTPSEGIPVSLSGAGWLVRDLAKQADLKTTAANGRTETTVDLVTEPCTLLACYRSPPGKVTLKLSARAVAAGTAFAGAAAVRAQAGGADMGTVPVHVTARDAAGQLRHEYYGTAGQAVTVPIPALEPAGTWQFQAQELLTGLTATAAIAVTAPAAPAVAAQPVADVHVVNRQHLQDFVSRTDEFLVIVEAGQEQYLPIAKRLTEAMTAAGVKARLWRPAGSDFDTIPRRWMPRPEDTARLKLVADGQLIGYRGQLTPYIDKKNRVHLPELGGYSEIEPLWMVGKDCVVFAGGRLAESLRAVTPWLPTPSVPGRGQGRLLVCFSPFSAGRAVTAVLANDLAGIEKAAAQLATTFKARGNAPAPAPTTPSSAAPGLAVEVAGDAAAPVPTPFRNYTPQRRVRHLLTTGDGKAAVLLNGKADTLAFVEPDGRVAVTVALHDTVTGICQVDTLGRFWDHPLRARAAAPDTKSPGHAAPPANPYLRGVDRTGALVLDVPCMAGVPVDAPPDWRTGFALAPDGALAAFPRPAGIWLGPPGKSDNWVRFSDLPFVRNPWEVRQPRLPIGTAFSPDGKYLVFTMDTRARMGGMGAPQPIPYCSETLLVETATGKRVWGLRAPDDSRAEYAVTGGSAAVAAEGTRTALQDWYGVAWLVDKSGKVVQRVDPFGRVDLGRPLEHVGLGAWIARDGTRALFAYPGSLLLLDGTGSVTIPLPGVAYAALSASGDRAVVGTEAGAVRAYTAAGTLAWSVNAGGVAPQVALLDNGTVLAANSNGELLWLDAAGTETRRVNVAAVADQGQHPLRPVTGAAHQPPQEYQPPRTLAVAKKRLAAENIAAWKPEGAATGACGLTFHAVATPLTLTPPAETKECFARLVYRRPPANQDLRLVTVSGEGTETFLLDLPTPEYREVNVPVRGAGITVTVTMTGPAEIAEFTLWSLHWPGPNKAYVRDPNAGGADTGDTAAEEEGLKDLEDDKSAASGAAKECRIYVHNTDPDQVKGRFMKPEMQPFEVVNGKRFGNGKLPCWSFERCPGYRGGWFTVDFGAPTEIGLVATCDRASKQSGVARNLAVFTATGSGENVVHQTFAGVVGSDQFWHLLPLEPAAKLRVLGVKAFLSQSQPSGLSEVEAYK